MRIRTVKPEFWESESVGRLSRDARLLFIALFNFADDAGIFRASPRLIASRLFPYDIDATEKINGWLDELEQEKSIRLYTSGADRYGLIPQFPVHQKIDHPTRSRLPVPEGSARLRESSGEDQGIKGSRDQGIKGGGELAPVAGIPPPVAINPGILPVSGALQVETVAPAHPLSTGPDSPASVRTKSSGHRGRFIPPTYDQIIAWLAEMDIPASETARENVSENVSAFIDHYQSNGWKVGGKSPMIDWQAAFRNWCRKIPEFAPDNSRRTPARRYR